MTSREKRKQGFLAKAKEADEAADKALDLSTQEAWVRIAQGYRALAAALE